MPSHPDHKAVVERCLFLRSKRAATLLCCAVAWTLIPTRSCAETNLPVLTTCRAAHHLTSAEADRGYPVHLRAIVTYYEVEKDKVDPDVFVGDESGGVFVSLTSAPATPLVPGDLVELTGRTEPGQFAPIVGKAHVQVLGHPGLPQSAPRVGVGELFSGDKDGQFVEVEAVVHSEVIDDGLAVLTLGLQGGMILASTPAVPDVDYSGLVDAKILLRGNVAPLFNHQGQMTGGVLNFPGMPGVRVEQSAPPHPFAMPMDKIIDLMRYIPDPGIRHRVHLRGRVTLFWPGRMLCIHDETDSVCGQTQQTLLVKPGDWIDAVGFPIVGEFSPSLVEVEYQLLNAANERVPPLPSNTEMALHDESNFELITVTGEVIGEEEGAADPTVILSSGNEIFSAALAKDLSRNLKYPEKGSLLRVTGIASIQSGTMLNARGGFPVGKSFRLLLRSPGDLLVLQKPTWWSPVHSLWVLAVALTLTLLVLWRVVWLSRRVKQQSEVIHVQLLETAALKDAAESATLAAEFHAAHDDLTGARNRRTIFAELQREYDAAMSSGSTLGVIMIDLDHFKRVNDTYGHLAGDEVLRETVRRITVAVRSSDLVGRYGGEEFIVLLPRCDKGQLQICAERIRVAVCREPMYAGGIPVNMTTSVGTTVTMSSAYAMLDVLAAADEALYQAKNGGRNRVVLKDLATGRFAEAFGDPEPTQSTAA